TIYPSNDLGFAWVLNGSVPFEAPNGVTINMRAKATAPASPSDGTLLATSGFIANTSSPVTLTSTDTVTAWNFVWFEIVADFPGTVGATLAVYAAQVLFVNPTSGSTTTGVNVEILGPPLLYTSTINTWRLGAYSNTTGWPTCGTYHQ